MYKKPTDGIVTFLTIVGIIATILSTIRINNATYGTDNNTRQIDNSSEEKDVPINESNINNTSHSQAETTNNNSTDPVKPSDAERLDDGTYKVESVVDGDTIKIIYNNTLTSVRIIGVNTPETVDPRTTVECFGIEASNYLKQKLDGKTIRIATDSTQADRDKYNRLLRYIYLDNEDIGLSIIANGYGYEYTYNVPYAHQLDYKKAQSEAEKNNKGLWAPNICSETNSIKEVDATPPVIQPVQNQNNCNIKGNINWSGERIYHMPWQKYYESTKINVANGERWFCTEQEAISAGWRKAKV